MTLTLTKHDTSRRQVVPRRLDLFDRLFDDWSETFRRPVVFWPERGIGQMRVEEFIEDGTMVTRVEIPGIDPEKDVDVSVTGDTLHISAERGEEEKTEERDYSRREFHYGAFRRDLSLPKGTSEADVKAMYKDGILEIRVPMPEELAETGKKIPITTS
jgi:HSP20 family protein